MLDERFNKQNYKELSIVFMDLAQLVNIDGSIIKALSRVNELFPQDAPSGPIIQVLSHILMLRKLGKQFDITCDFSNIK